MLVCKVVEVWRNFLSEYVDKKFTYICYRSSKKFTTGIKLCNLQQLKIAVFTYHRPHFFVFPGDAPGAITLNVVWMERKFDAYKLSCRMYLSICNSFRVIRCLSQCVSPKIAIFLPHSGFPSGRPWGNHAKCCMDVKWIRCFFKILSLTEREVNLF